MLSECRLNRYDGCVSPRARTQTGDESAEAPVLDEAATEAPARRGRPLDADRTPAILDAVLELLTATGYDQLRVQDVAERAGVGLGTIYRRWPTKQALVVEALRCGRAIDEKFANTGDPRTDLEATFAGLARSMAEKGDMVGFIASLRREPEVAEAFRCTAIDGMRERLRALVAAARGTTVDDPALDALVDIGPALIFYRVAVAGDTEPPEEMAREVVDLVLAHPGARSAS
jgi:AcrR family transcriptional regulator